MSASETTRFHDSDVGKSYNTSNAQVKYTVDNSLKLHPSQKALQENTLAKAGRSGRMLGAPEVLQLGANLLRAIGGKKVLDIGMFTGASALSWALAIADDGVVHTMDVSDEAYVAYGKEIIEKESVSKKINIHIRPATETLNSLIANGETGTFDFAFIDADKTNYDQYYEKSLTLLRSGGIILIDNAMWSGAVCGPESTMTPDTLAIHRLNQKIHQDDRVNCSLLTTGDGSMIVFKK